MTTPEKEHPLPEGWIKCYSKSLQGKMYYFNTLTGESLWEHPEQSLLEDQVRLRYREFLVTVIQAAEYVER